MRLLKNAKNLRALNFREIRALANLRENKVLAKIKCYTVHRYNDHICLEQVIWFNISERICPEHLSVH